MKNKRIVVLFTLIVLLVINMNIPLSRPEVSNDPVANLQCSGTIIFYINVKPGSTVYNTFEVMNVGDPGSKLDWEVFSVPSWGTWTITPSKGNGLRPENGSVTINVSVVMPKLNHQFPGGNITVINLDDPSDCAAVPVALVDPAPNVRITKPYRAVFKDNKVLFPFLVPVIIGEINVTVDSTKPIWRVDFSIDGELKYTDTTEPFCWTWNDSAVFSRHTIETYVYGRGYSTPVSIHVWKLK